LGNPLGRHARLIVENAPEMLAVGEDFGLEREKSATRIDEVHARQPILERDLLGPHVLPDRHRIVRAPFDGGVVGDNQDLAARHAADTRHDAGRRCVAVVEVPGGQRRELQERGSLVEQRVDPLAHRKLALLAVPLDILRSTPLTDGGGTVAQLSDEREHTGLIGQERFRTGVNVGLEDVH
jgi:hypothetical protein